MSLDRLSTAFQLFSCLRLGWPVSEDIVQRAPEVVQ